ncbi:MAG: hypothetical protein BMS9Abin11_1711 [Gammaproteobacteria bacterium]|nr:MAG: hypothetical protein BMS9Abin11_1711 [Gammaproteobacteria bacterium]
MIKYGIGRYHKRPDWYIRVFTVKIISMKFFVVSLIAPALFIVNTAWAERNYDILIDKETTLTVQHYPGTSDIVLLWFPSEAGITRDDIDLAKVLARSGFDVHIAGTLDARFLSALRSSMEKIPASDVSATITYIMKNYSGKVVLMSSERGAVSTLRGLRTWLNKARVGDKKRLQGLIMLSPNLYVETPQPGKDAQYLPVVANIKTSVYIFQPMLSPKYWWYERLQKELRKGGSKVKVEVLMGVRDRFYYRHDASKRELDKAEQYPQLLTRAIKALSSLGR